MNVAKIFINILIFITECCANVLGINTQENPNHRNFVKKLNLNEKFDNLETELADASDYLDRFRQDPIPRTLGDVFKPTQRENNFDVHFVFKYMEQNRFGFKDPDSCVAFAISDKAILLPDNISEYLQLNFGMHTYDLLYTAGFREIQYWSHAFIFGFLALWSLNTLMSFCLFINPYRYPFVLLTTLMDPIAYALEDIFPTVLGWNIGYYLLPIGLGFPMDFISDLSLTMPYLPSEATLKVVGENTMGENISFYVFSGIPELWIKHGIPEDLRKDWFDQNNISIMKYYLRILPKDWDILPADLGRIRVLALEGDLDMEDIRRAFDNTLRDLKSMGLTKEELKTMIESAKKGIEY